MLEHQDAVGGGYGNSAPEPPSPMTTAMMGTPMARQQSVERAMASACPLSSAPMPGYAPRRVDHREDRHAETIASMSRTALR